MWYLILQGLVCFLESVLFILFLSMPELELMRVDVIRLLSAKVKAFELSLVMAKAFKLSLAMALAMELRKLVEA